MRVATWNTQGSFMEGAKHSIIKKIYDGTNVLFLQEGGVDKRWDDGLFTTVQGSSVGAKNERCTNYVLINRTFWNAHCTEVDFATIGGGIAGRKPAAVQVGDALFVSWHSEASSNSSDTKQLLRECQRKLQLEGINVLIIGGDFNAKPSDIETMIVSMARASSNYCIVCAPPTDMPTHAGDRVLDFFVIMTTGAVPSGQVWVHPVEPSDHDPVFMDVA